MRVATGPITECDGPLDDWPIRQQVRFDWVVQHDCRVVVPNRRRVVTRDRMRLKGKRTAMYFHEQIALQLANERIAERLRFAETERVVRSAVARTSVRVRLGRCLVRLGHRITGQPLSAFS